MNTEERMVKHKDARILRECIARLHRFSPPQIKQYIDTQMKLYAKGVSEYCEHHDKSVISMTDQAFVEGCLDCGKRFSKPTIKEGEQNGNHGN